MKRRSRPTPTAVRLAAFERANGRCDAWWPHRETGQYVRCRRPAQHPHHRLTRARGGRLIEHVYAWTVVAVCPACHLDAEGGNDGKVLVGLDLKPLTVRGSVRTALDGTPVYIGPDREFAAAINGGDL